MNRDDQTEPIINYICKMDQSRQNQYLKESLNLTSARIKDNLSSIKRHKKILGKQNYCWTGFVKHWIWEADIWRVYVSKEGGSLEVLSSLSVEGAWLAWQDYYSKMK